MFTRCFWGRVALLARGQTNRTTFYRPDGQQSPCRLCRWFLGTTEEETKTFHVSSGSDFSSFLKLSIFVMTYPLWFLRQLNKSKLYHYLRWSHSGMARSLRDTVPVLHYAALIKTRCFNQNTTVNSGHTGETLSFPFVTSNLFFWSLCNSSCCSTRSVSAGFLHPLRLFLSVNSLVAPPASVHHQQQRRRRPDQLGGWCVLRADYPPGDGYYSVPAGFGSVLLVFFFINQTSVGTFLQQLTATTTGSRL